MVKKNRSSTRKTFRFYELPEQKLGWQFTARCSFRIHPALFGENTRSRSENFNFKSIYVQICIDTIFNIKSKFQIYWVSLKNDHESYVE